MGPQTKWNNGRNQDRTGLRYIGQQRKNWRDHVNRMDRRKILKHCAVRALRLKIHRASGKKIPQDHNRPHDLTHVLMMMMMTMTTTMMMMMMMKNKMNCGSVCKVIIMCCISYLEWSETRKLLMYCTWKLSVLCYGLKFTVLIHMLLCIIFNVNGNVVIIW